VNKIAKEEQALLSRYIQSICGVSLDESKGYLLETRLGTLLPQLGFGSFQELYFKAKTDPTKSIERKIIEAITTGETMFFRDGAPFELLRHKILPDIIDRKTARIPKGGAIALRIWSAACSSGQEVYSIAMVLRELLGSSSKHNLRVLGTDISDAAVTRASRGIFQKIEIERGLPKETLEKHFTCQGDTWQVRDELRALASFRRLNLLEDFTFLGKFDVVFCRNVAIYFEEKDKVRLFEGIAKVLEPGGALIIGSTESLLNVCSRFESRRYLRSVFYHLGDAVGAPAPIPAPAAPRPALKVPVLATA
jgi:chemotaxis protein methyltransferase CheR